MCLKTLPYELHPWCFLIGCSIMTIWAPHVSPCWSGSPVFISFHSDLQHGEVLQPYTSPRFVCAWSKYSFPPLKHTSPFVFTLERGQVFLWAKLSRLLGYSKVTCRRESLTKTKELVQQEVFSSVPRAKDAEELRSSRWLHETSCGTFWLTDTHMSLQSLLLTLKRKGHGFVPPPPQYHRLMFTT